MLSLNFKDISVVTGFSSRCLNIEAFFCHFPCQYFINIQHLHRFYLRIVQLLRHGFDSYSSSRPYFQLFSYQSLISLVIVGCQMYRNLANIRDLIGLLPKGVCEPDRQSTDLPAEDRHLIPDIPIGSFAKYIKKDRQCVKTSTILLTRKTNLFLRERAMCSFPNFTLLYS